MTDKVGEKIALASDGVHCNCAVNGGREAAQKTSKKNELRKGARYVTPANLEGRVDIPRLVLQLCSIQLYIMDPRLSEHLCPLHLSSLSG